MTRSTALPAAVRHLGALSRSRVVGALRHIRFMQRVADAPWDTAAYRLEAAGLDAAAQVIEGRWFGKLDVPSRALTVREAKRRGLL